MPNASLSHFVALYWIPAGCVIVEVDGAAVSQYGPFAKNAQPLALAASMFPELLTVELPAQAEMLDDEAVLILGNWACHPRRAPSIAGRRE